MSNLNEGYSKDIYSMKLFLTGFKATQLDIVPRWFWSKSANELFSFTLFSVLGYAWSFAIRPGAIYFIYSIVWRIE